METYFQIDGIPCRLDMKDPFDDQSYAVIRLTHKVDTDGDEDLDDEGFPTSAQVFEGISNIQNLSAEEVDSLFLAFIEKINKYLEELFTVGGDVPEAPDTPWERLEWLIENGVQVDSKSLKATF